MHTKVCLLILSALCPLTGTAAVGQAAAMSIAAEDKSHNPVTDLKLSEVSVKIDGIPAVVTSLQYMGDSPAYWVLAVDCSNSMRNDERWRSSVDAAAHSLISLMHDRGDRVSVAAISDTSVHLHSFMSKEQAVTAAVGSLQPAGATALYDSLLAVADYLRQNSPPGRRQIIWVITDGDDNMSNSPVERVVERFSGSGIPLVFSLLEDNASVPFEGKRQMEKLARNSGGAVFPIESKRRSAEAANQIILFSHKAYRVVFPVPTDTRDHKLETGVNRAGVKFFDAKRSIHVAEPLR